MHTRSFIALLVLCFSLPCLAAEPTALKKRVAVFSFEDKTDGSLGWWRGDDNVGEGLADMLISALVKSEQYVVIERSRLSEVLKEQSLGATGAIDEQSAAQIGKVLGVEIGVFGAVTDFSVSEDAKTNRAPIRTPFGNRSVGLTVTKTEARVRIDVRLVNTSTGEILIAESVVGTQADRGVSVASGRMAFKNESEFDESMVGKATRKAMTILVARIGEQMRKVPWEGKIVKSEGTAVVINAGSSIGIAVGDTMVVYQQGEELTDPDTGVRLGAERTRIGTIKVSADMADGKAAKCTVIEGSGGNRGDIVKYR